MVSTRHGPCQGLPAIQSFNMGRAGREANKTHAESFVSAAVRHRGVHLRHRRFDRKACRLQRYRSGAPARGGAGGSAARGVGPSKDPRREKRCRCGRGLGTIRAQVVGAAALILAGGVSGNVTDGPKPKNQPERVGEKLSGELRGVTLPYTGRPRSNAYCQSRDGLRPVVLSAST